MRGSRVRVLVGCLSAGPRGWQVRDLTGWVVGSPRVSLAMQRWPCDEEEVPTMGWHVRGERQHENALTEGETTRRGHNEKDGLKQS